MEGTVPTYFHSLFCEGSQRGWCLDCGVLRPVVWSLQATSPRIQEGSQGSQRSRQGNAESRANNGLFYVTCTVTAVILKMLTPIFYSFLRAPDSGRHYFCCLYPDPNSRRVSGSSVLKSSEFLQLEIKKYV